MNSRTKVFWRQLSKGKWRMPLRILNNIARGIVLWHFCLRCGGRKPLTNILCSRCKHAALMEFLEAEDV